MKGFGNLLEGYRRFRANRFESERQRWRDLAEGQKPRAIVIACSDSRADGRTGRSATRRVIVLAVIGIIIGRAGR